jgi:hypothetical protein
MSTPQLSRSAKLYQERRLPNDRLTRRLPTARSDFDRCLAHSLPLTPPLPIPDLLRGDAAQPPDAGLTTPWPTGEE